MISALKLLGVQTQQRLEYWEVSGPTRLRAPDRPLQVGNAGTAARFLTGLAPLVRGSYVVDGDEAMRRRPMAGLLKALADLGVVVEQLGKRGCPPVRLRATQRFAPDGPPPRVRLEAGGSSQELSALLLLGAAMPAGLHVYVDGQLPSMPYVGLTCELLSDFHIDVQQPSGQCFHVGPGRPWRKEYTVEGDWSSASYPLAVGWLTGDAVQVTNVRRDSKQGDRIFPQLLAQLQQLGPRTMSLGQQPDLVPTIVACSLFAQGQTAITDVAHLRIKESDRICGLVGELSKLGADINEQPDGIRLRSRVLSGPAVLDPAHDHRLAMAFGLVSLRVSGIRVLDPDCVSKSYPGYWSMLEQFRTQRRAPRDYWAQR